MKKQSSAPASNMPSRNNSRANNLVLEVNDAFDYEPANVCLMIHH
jgi:hypothetical protein